MAEEITYQGYEYRYQCGEFHRRPVRQAHHGPEERSWLVLNRDDDFVPPIIKTHFEQAQNKSAVY